MPEWIRALWNDIVSTWELLRAVDFAQPSYVGLWFVIILTPLVGIDRRDPFAGMVYVVFCAAAGVALIVALPQRYVPPASLGEQIGTVLFCSVVAAIRWTYGASSSGKKKLEELDPEVQFQQTIKKVKKGK